MGEGGGKRTSSLAGPNAAWQTPTQTARNKLVHFNTAAPDAISSPLSSPSEVGDSEEKNNNEAALGEENKVSGEEDSVAGEEDSVAGEEDSVAGEKDSVAGEEDSVAGEEDSVAGEKESAPCSDDNDDDDDTLRGNSPIADEEAPIATDTDR